MSIGLMEIDIAGNIVKPYPIFSEIVGYEALKIIGKKATDIFLTEG